MWITDRRGFVDTVNELTKKKKEKKNSCLIKKSGENVSKLRLVTSVAPPYCLWRYCPNRSSCFFFVFFIFGS